MPTLPADERIDAPWNAEQIDALNRFQRLGFVHEFTCPRHHNGADRALVATKYGWICPHCDYKQSWAHPEMLRSWKNPLPDPRDVFVEFVSHLLDAPGDVNPRRMLETVVASAKVLKNGGA